MSVSVPIDGEIDDPDAVRLTPGAMGTLEVAPGDAVSVRGDELTFARVGDPLPEETEGLRAGSRVLTAAGLAVGDAAAVASAAAPPAAAVTVAPPAGFRFEGVGDAVRDELRGRRVARGDEVRPDLFDGALEVRFVVVDVAPADPAVVTAATEVVVRDEPADPSALAGGTDRTYDDVGGMDGSLAALRNAVAVPLENPEAFRSLAGRPPVGVLIEGPPGSGKTLLADAVGNETDARYVRIPHVDAVDSRYENGFESLAVEAVRAAPTVVLLDDVDEMAPDAGGGGRAAEIAAFLDAVAGEDVVVVGTTANADDVDRSLRRGGRFGHEIDVGAPDVADRREILEILLADVRAGPDVDPAAIAERTHGFVGADLQVLVERAVQNALDRAGAGDGEGTPLDAVSVTAADVEAALEEVSPSGMRGLRIERPDVTYGDVGGLDAAKREVVRAVEWPLVYPELLDRVSTTAPTGILLHGLPGTGKTMLARAVANATDANFVAVEGPELLDRYVGESERSVREVFDRAARNAPSVLFFDEIDALAPERSGDGDAEVTERVVSQLLTELDGIEPRQGVVVIGATNRPDVIDPALLRPGRLERVVEVPMPDREAREEIFRTHAADVPTADVDVARLAAKTEGYNGSDVEAVVREAGLLAVEEHLRERADDPAGVDPASVVVRGRHFDRALEVVDPSVSEAMRQRYADIVEEIES